MADASMDIVPDDLESVSESGTESLTWIGWFCSLPGHEYFAEVSEDFIEDDFNLTGLNALVPFYREALEMILDVEPLEEDSPKIPDVSIVESSAELLYGLIHQRYILTAKGMQQMVDMYGLGHFGYCPRVYCHSHPVLPCGRSDLPGLDTVKLFCPNCMDCYAPPSSRFHSVDGAFFGITFPHLVLQSCRDLAPAPIAPEWYLATYGKQDLTSDVADLGSTEDETGVIEEASTLPRSQLGQEPPRPLVYVPRIYGFRVSELAKSGPRMQWLRARPRSYAELIGQPPADTKKDANAEQVDQVPMSTTPSVVGDSADRRTDHMSISESGV